MALQWGLHRMHRGQWSQCSTRRNPPQPSPQDLQQSLARQDSNHTNISITIIADITISITIIVVIGIILWC